MKKKSSFLLFVLLFAHASLAESSKYVPNTGQSLLKVFGALIFVVFTIFAVAWLAKKLKLAGMPGGNQIKALSVLPLGRKEKLLLIESCGEKMLIGVGASSINVLRVFPKASREESTAVDESSLATITDTDFTHEKEARQESEVWGKEKVGKESPDFSKFLKAVLSGRSLNG